MATTPRNIRFDDDLYAKMMALGKRPLTGAWHIQEACRQYLASKTQSVILANPAPTSPVKAKKVEKEIVDYSVFGMSEDQIKELIRIRRKNKGGAITQRVANSLSKEFHLACSNGFTFDDLLTEWEVRGWKSFKAEWVKPAGQFGGGKLSSFEKTVESIKDVELPDMRND